MRTRWVMPMWMALILGTAMISCGSEGPAEESALTPQGEKPDDGAADPAQPGRPQLGRCVDAPRPVFESPEKWQHPLSGLVAMQPAGHSAQDLLLPEGEPVILRGKFAYGVFSKDLEGESIQVWMDDCSGEYKLLGEAVTDSDGRIALSLSADQVPAIGEYALHFRVKGDSSATAAVLCILPPQTELVVFDIDGTLTTSDTELISDVFTDLFTPILHGSYVPQARASARELTRLRATQGYQLLYLTGRPYLLTERTRLWLADLGFARGSLHVTDSNAEAVPNVAGVGTFKASYLTGLKKLGFVLRAAYGNATTDIHAYGQAGIDPQRTFIVGPNGGKANTVALGDGYDAHLTDPQLTETVQQPFQLPQPRP